MCDCNVVCVPDLIIAEVSGFFVTEVDLILIMSVNPGFGGQSFIESQVKKIAELRKICNEKVSTWIKFV